MVMNGLMLIFIFMFDSKFFHAIEINRCLSFTFIAFATVELEPFPQVAVRIINLCRRYVGNAVSNGNTAMVWVRCAFYVRRSTCDLQ